MPPSLVDEVVHASGRGERRMRPLPAPVMVCFVLAVVLFPGCGYRRAWAALKVRWPGSVVADPSAAALCQATCQVSKIRGLARPTSPAAYDLVRD